MNDEDAVRGGRHTANMPNAHQQYEVTPQELPLHCPLEGTTLWNSHPRVYLPIEDTGKERCPYCGTVYLLKV